MSTNKNNPDTALGRCGIILDGLGIPRNAPRPEDGRRVNLSTDKRLELLAARLREAEGEVARLTESLEFEYGLGCCKAPE